MGKGEEGRERKSARIPSPASGWYANPISVTWEVVRELGGQDSEAV